MTNPKGQIHFHEDNVTPQPLTKLSTWKAVLAASRPISWINTAFPFGAAYLLFGGNPGWVFWLGCLFFLIPYNIAMYGINDVFDYESDIRNPRKGGVEGAVLSKALHPALLKASLITVVPLAVFLFAAGTVESGTWLAISLFAVVAYSMKYLRFKERPVLDSVTSSAHFVTPALVGAAMAPNDETGQFYLAMGAFFCWGMASHAFGAVQDVRADREAGLSSIATAFGARAVTRLTVALYAAAAGTMFFLPNPAWIVGVFGLGYVAITARFWNITDETCEQSNASWRAFLWLNYIVGAAVTMALICANVGF